MHSNGLILQVIVRYIRQLFPFFVCFFVSCCVERHDVNDALQHVILMDIVRQKKVTVIFPAGAISPQNLEYLKNALPSTVDFSLAFIDTSHPFHAANDTVRYSALSNAIKNDEGGDIIWCGRGGYGVSKLLKRLMQIPYPQRSKVIIGYSDITALHIFASQRYGWYTVHGANLQELLDHSKNPQNFIQIGNFIDQLDSKKGNKSGHLVIDGLVCMNRGLCDKRHHITGRLTGGNLTIVTTTIGTPWQIKTQGKILFLEDSMEKGYSVDRHLQHLYDAGILDGVVAVIFGTFSCSKKGRINCATVSSVLQTFAANAQFPVFYSNKIGHGNTNLPILYNAVGIIMQNDSDVRYKSKDSDGGNQVNRPYSLTMHFPTNLHP